MLCGSHIKIWNLANHMKKLTKSIKILDLLIKNWKLRFWWSLFHFFHVICKISNFNMWTAKHLAQASCTELSLLTYHCEITNINLNHYLQWTMATFVFRSCLKQCFNINDFPQPSGPTSKKGCLIPGSNQCKRVAIIPFTSEVWTTG